MAEREEIEAIAEEAGIPCPPERDADTSAMAILRRYDPRCPHPHGYVIAKCYSGSIMSDWYDGEMFAGLIETLPGKPPVYHQLCLSCSSHFIPIGSVAQLPRAHAVH